MKTLNTLIIAISAAFLISSCSTDNYEDYTEIELPESPIIVEYENPLAISSARGSDYLLEGLAYETKNFSTGESIFTIASEGVEVECPGSATSYDGGDVFFLFQFVTVGEGLLTFGGRMVVEIDGKKRFASWIPLPDCETDLLNTEYSIEDERISGTITGEYHYYADVLIEPFSSCENFISTGELTVSFDLPLTRCN